MSIDYQTFIFDNDGVLLDSNDAKDRAFVEVATPYGEEATAALLEYHRSFGGVSRFEKLEYLFRDLLGMDQYERELRQSLERFGEISLRALLEAEETQGMRAFLERLPPGARRFVVSGGKQAEIRTAFARRGLDRYFEGIYGSPEDKTEHMRNLRESGALDGAVVFVGDSRTDYEVARAFDCDFVFLKKYTGFTDWRAYFEGREDLVFLDTFDDWD